ncbi:MAG: hypothetical protein A2624_06350 [Gammaproteobacteria bacterium RIFCSPHIGHO2_01_FULL_42_8]|nr:MAG: hypothetical protein A2624_06350 [Gammaproteobacteria bacterium RIFCSPHIGHO2_01_FULL_42_8]
MAERGQVTIPKALRKKLGIKPGMILDFQIKKSTLIAVKLGERDVIDSVYGCLKLKKSTNQLIKELRGKG